MAMGGLQPFNLSAGQFSIDAYTPLMGFLIGH